jgi:chromosome segregation protein
LRLVRLELFGFKSFCERTVFHFNEGITSIVGPNGCGKSNIVDAIIWTLGERGTRSLRIKDMDDVIFHGSNGRKGLNIAEVTITLSDEKGEYSVRRRIFRDGTNEYFLNGRPVRLKDIHDFFLGTGVGTNSYAIIEQGRIEAFVQMKPKERKILIDEAGGITRFKEKKEEAEKRLEEVRLNLERVEDILREVQSSYKKAELEWERWKRYMELVERKRGVEIQILLDGLRRMKRNFDRANEKFLRLREEINKKMDEERALEERLNLKGRELSLNEKVLTELELKVVAKEKDFEAKLKEINYKRNEISLLSLRQKEIEEKIKDTTEKIIFCEEELKRLTVEESKVTEYINRRSSELKALVDLVNEMKEEMKGKEMELEKKRMEFFGTVSELTEVNNKISEIERKKRERDERERRIKEEKEGLEKRISSLEEQILNLKVRLESKKAELAECEKKLSKRNRELMTLKEQIEERERLITSFRMEKKAKEEYLRELGQLTGQKKENGGQKKLIDVIKVNQIEEALLERYFGRELECYVIEEGAHTLHEYLTAPGNYIFFPEKGIFEKREDGIAIKFKWVESGKEALDRILSGEEGIFVNGSIVIDSRGIILKESNRDTIDLKAEKERRRIQKEIGELEEKIEFVSKEHSELLSSWNNLERDHRDFMQKIGSLKKENENLEKEIWTYEAVLKEAEERLRRLDDFEALEEETILDSETQTDLYERKELLSKKKDESDSEIRSLKFLVEESRRSLEEVWERQRKLEIELEREKSKIPRIQAEKGNRMKELKELKDLELRLFSEREECKKRIETEILSLEALEKDCELIKEECNSNAKRVEELKIGIGLLHEERERMGSELKEKRKEIERIRAKSEALEKEVLLLSEKISQVEKVLSSTYNIDPEMAEGELSPPSVLEEERRAIEEEIESLGEINFRAEKEYYELKERAEFLEKQKEDLKSAMESLRRTISKIDSVSKDIFFETLDRVNDYYKRYVHRLFLGGEGYLKYNPETEGVEMFAQPQGKKITRMEMLSGGEKALSSLALLLALIEVNPPPFCFMDEIDAPLDDANLTYLLQMIKDLSKKTQIIFITHNRLTMEVSGTIYGITMEEEGVSKIVSVRL